MLFARRGASPARRVRFSRLWRSSTRDGGRCLRSSSALSGPRAAALGGWLGCLMSPQTLEHLVSGRNTPAALASW